ncbi:FAD-dependent monooxygenase [uncultured Alsobacter sp.]|uniref:FAD-dependent monooxygenase n=1 Tax=uncultured Alsobacter sp. TaxID=1748258 RepID=UPI0025E7DB94|nr:FAD-dependent monooxygenase [uncultured Alsobacter sp.]
MSSASPDLSPRTPSSVLIVGAGPVGLTLAVELTRFGIPVRIIDKAVGRTDKSKAIVLWSRTLELLDRQPGGAAAFVAAGFKVDTVGFVAHGQPIAHASVSSAQTPFAFALMLPQSETERLLEERLEALGVTVERQVEVVALALRDDGVDATLRHADGRQETAPADWLAGCDGAHSIVRHTVGAQFTGTTLDSDWVLADIHMTGYPVPDTQVTIAWHEDGVFVVFPMSPGRYRIIADTPPSGAAHPPTPTLDDIQALIDRRGPAGMRAFDPVWLAGFRINGRKVSRYRWGRAFLCGDAAHVHSPAGGQGMNTGMQDAFNLAWKLALVSRRVAADGLLDSFSVERSAVGDQVLAAAERLTTIGTTKNPFLRLVRNTVAHVAFGIPGIEHAFAQTMTELSIGYPESPLTSGSAAGLDGPRPGQRLLADRPFGTGELPRFALLAAATEPALRLLQSYPALLEADLREPPDRAGAWLVRPDGYVAAVARSHDMAAIEACLAQVALSAGADPAA